MRKLLILLMLTAWLLTAAGCGKQEPAQTPEPPAEPTQTESVPADPAAMTLLPDAFPMKLHFSSGAGGWGTELTLQRDGSFTGQYHDSDMGSGGTDFPNGTVYLCGFEGQFGDFREAEYGSVALTLEELTVVTEQSEPWIEDGIRYIPSTPYGLEGGTDFLLYGPETPWETLSDSALMGWPLSGEPTFTLDCWGLCNTAQQQTFYDWSYWFPEGEPEHPEETAEQTETTVPE